MNSQSISPEVLQQNPGLAMYMLFVSGMVFLALIGSLFSWGLIFYRKNNQPAILPLQRPWMPRQWGFIDLLVIAFFVVMSQILLAGGVRRILGLEIKDSIPMEVAAAGGLGSLLAVALGLVWICVRYRVRPSHVGFTLLNRNLLITGVVAGAASLPVMYVVMGIISAVSSTKYKHPLIESATESAQLHTYLLGVFAAALAAPIAEEFLFRVVLQGWLQSIPFKSVVQNLLGLQLPESTPVATTAPSENQSQLTNSEHSEIGIATVGTLPSANPYAPPALIDTVQPSAAIDVVPPLWPSIVAGVLFGLAHFEYGLSFVPLSVLGILLGWIYRQTHSIWPCIIIHMMLNSFSMMMLGLLILLKQAGVPVQ